MKLKTVQVKDGTYIQAVGRSLSGNIGPGEVIGPWVKVTLERERADGPATPVDVLIWGGNIAASEIEQSESWMHPNANLQIPQEEMPPPNPAKIARLKELANENLAAAGMPAQFDPITDILGEK